MVSNSPAVLAEIPDEDRASEIVINDGQNPMTKTLGIAWNSQTDEFKISTSKGSQPQLTKRNILRKIATIFDPLGFVSPFTVVAKILLQELWARGYGWDDEIADEIALRIAAKWFDQLKQLNTVKILRCLRAIEPVVSTKLITFTDASVEAYGCAVYIRHEYESHEVTCRLVTSKSKVAPLTLMTVPKLELMGAVLGLRLAQSVIVVLGIPMQDVLFYSDSIDVLWWIRGRGKEFRPFIANRVVEIQNNSDPSQWQHVSTHENPADLCTRGTSPSQLAENALWWEGPAWIKKEEVQWPRMKFDNHPDELSERRTMQSTSEDGGVVLAVNTQRDEGTSQPKGNKTWRLDPLRFSDWSWYIRVFARVKRALYNMRNPDQRKAERELTIDEIKEAEQDVMRLAQQDGFHEDYELVKRSKPLPSSSPLIKLNPIID